MLSGVHTLTYPPYPLNQNYNFSHDQSTALNPVLKETLQCCQGRNVLRDKPGTVIKFRLKKFFNTDSARPLKQEETRSKITDPKVILCFTFSPEKDYAYTVKTH